MAEVHCHVCDDTGCCPTCEGRGSMPNPLAGKRMPCGTCFGSGDCPACAQDCETPNDYQQKTAQPS